MKTLMTIAFLLSVFVFIALLYGAMITLNDTYLWLSFIMIIPIGITYYFYKKPIKPPSMAPEELIAQAKREGKTSVVMRGRRY